MDARGEAADFQRNASNKINNPKLPTWIHHIHRIIPHISIKIYLIFITHRVGLEEAA